MGELKIYSRYRGRLTRSRTPDIVLEVPHVSDSVGEPCAGYDVIDGADLDTSMIAEADVSNNSTHRLRNNCTNTTLAASHAYQQLYGIYSVQLTEANNAALHQH